MIEVKRCLAPSAIDSTDVPRAHDISISLVGAENHKAHPDFSNDSGFWLRVTAEDAAPFVQAFKSSPAVFHEFRIEQRVGKQVRTSTLMAQIVKIEEGPTEARALIRTDPKVEAAQNYKK